MKRKAVSATYIKTFIQCPQKFFYSYYTDKQPIVSGDSRAFGTAVHEALEFMYKRLSNRGEMPTEDDYNAVFDVFLKSGIKNNLSDQSLYDEGRLILKNRLDSYSPLEKTIGLELKFGLSHYGDSIDLETKAGTPIAGAIDKLDELDSDTLVVVDYKTSRTALTDQEAALDEQLSMYDLAVSLLYPQYKSVIIVLDYLRLGPVITHRTEEQRVWFSKFVDSIYEQAAEITEESAKPRLNEFCGWCDYRHYCNAYSKVITDPSLFVKPLELYSNDEFIEEWGRFSNIRKLVDQYKRELSMHASGKIHFSGENEIRGKDNSLYMVQTSSVQYDVGTILRTVPMEDAINLLSVKKQEVDKYLADHPQYSQQVLNTARVSFATPYFKQRKSKK